MKLAVTDPTALEPVRSLQSARKLAPQLSGAEVGVAARGIQPALIDEETAAAICGRSMRRFRAECPLPGQRVGRKTLRPLDLVKDWAVRNWASATGFELAATAVAADDDDDWLSELPSDNAFQSKRGATWNCTLKVLASSAPAD